MVVREMFVIALKIMLVGAFAALSIGFGVDGGWKRCLFFFILLVLTILVFMICNM